jgi:hypothetical protein
MAVHKGPASLRPRCTWGGSFVAAIPVYRSTLCCSMQSLCLFVMLTDLCMLQMMECGRCKCWVHAKCEGLSDEKYQVLSYLPESVEFICRLVILFYFLNNSSFHSI